MNTEALFLIKSRDLLQALGFRDRRKSTKIVHVIF